MIPVLVGLCVLVAGSIHWYVVIRKIWADREYAEQRVDLYSFLPYGPAARRGFVRGIAALPAMIFFVFGFLTASGISDLRGESGHGPAAKVGLLCVILAFLSVLTHLSIIWFNFPRFFAVPSMKDDVGVVTAAWRRRFGSR